MHEVIGLVAFAFAGSASPGPNNTLLWASGMRFGFGAAIPHVLGTAIGIGGLVVAVEAGVGAVLDAVPALAVALKVVGSAYLLFVAYLVLGGGAVGRAHVSRPLSAWQAIGFQFVNPKAWVFAVAAVGTFFPTQPHLGSAIVLTATLMLVVVASSSVWAGGGAMLGRVIENERALRLVNVVLAALLVASVVLIWI
jgi:threonine/homoserine/homoserine lactone efflux protein